MNSTVQRQIEQLELTRSLSLDEYEDLLKAYTEESASILREKAVAVRKRVYGNHIYVRGLIEFSNICKNDCFYCGIRRSNANCDRYRLTPEEILDCCEAGYALGFRTFVLQGGEDTQFHDDVLCRIIETIRYRSERGAVKAINGFLTRVLIAIYCGTKPPMKSITKSYIQCACPLQIVCNVFLI